MNRVARMMLMADRSGESDGRRYETKRADYRHDDGTYGRYDDDGVYDRYRDRRGREHYDSGRYAPMNRGDYELERRDRLDWDSMRYQDAPESRYVGGNVYPMRQSMETQNRRKIGFSIGGEMEHLPNDEHMTRGAYHEPFTRQTAEEWVSHMQNADGTTGQHWSLEQAQQLMAQRKINCDPVRFYTALNAVYSDFCGVAKKHGVSNVEFFADLAKAWLDDKDAVPDKLEMYHEYIVKH